MRKGVDRIGKRVLKSEEVLVKSEEVCLESEEVFLRIEVKDVGSGMQV